MRKITLLLLVFTFFISQAQSTTTGEITLTPGFTVQFDVDGPNDTVTMTMVGPSNVWLGVALDVSTGNSMGFGGEDVILYNSNGLVDAKLTGSQNEPNPNESQNWTVISNAAPGSVRTIVATRALDTGDSADYVFTTHTGNLNLLWAKGNGLSMGYHANRGGAQANFTLSSADYFQKEFKIYPNPTVDELNFEFPDNVQSANVQVYNILGKQIMQTQLKRTVPKLNTSSWASGMYVVQIITEDAVQTKRIIKQ
ncbi:MAG: T9SS type A sorting domain-containing protein [Bacteroidetes bacterium]|nr:T9SS type A sorting domain-containing protein [Bacteroidota bacterium]